MDLEKCMTESFEAGEPVIFTWAEMLREKLQEYDLEKTSVEPEKVLEEKNLTPKKLPPIEIFSGEPIIDRKSTFQAFFAKVSTCKDAKRFREQLLENQKIARATHNMFVYKVNQNGIIKSDCDEDGESGAGKNS